MPGVLLDTGPLVAYLYPRDAYHEWAIRQFEISDLPFLTCEAVLTESCFLVARNGQAATRVLDMLTRGVVRIGLGIGEEIAAVHGMMTRYANVPMSLADACIVRMTEIYQQYTVLTLDSDFTIYRKHGHEPLALISPAPG